MVIDGVCFEGDFDASLRCGFYDQEFIIGFLMPADQLARLKLLPVLKKLLIEVINNFCPVGGIIIYSTGAGNNDSSILSRDTGVSAHRESHHQASGTLQGHEWSDEHHRMPVAPTC
jgi:hypothetical protein